MVFIQEVIHGSWIKHGSFVINLNDWNSIGTHWIAFYVNGDGVRYFILLSNIPLLDPFFRGVKKLIYSTKWMK